MMNGHESNLVEIMIKIMIMVTIMVKINDELRNLRVYIWFMSSIPRWFLLSSFISIDRTRVHWTVFLEFIHLNI